MTRTGKDDGVASRRDRLARELRENLKRRKAKTRSERADDNEKERKSAGQDARADRDR